jgi:hypothetical protein
VLLESVHVAPAPAPRPAAAVAEDRARAAARHELDHLRPGAAAPAPVKPVRSARPGEGTSAPGERVSAVILRASLSGDVTPASLANDFPPIDNFRIRIASDGVPGHFPAERRPAPEPVASLPATEAPEERREPQPGAAMRETVAIVNGQQPQPEFDLLA